MAEKPDEAAAIRIEAAVADEGEKGQVYVSAPQGLFPSPIHHSSQPKGAYLMAASWAVRHPNSTATYINSGIMT